MAQLDSELTRIPDVETPAQSEGFLAGRKKFIVGGVIIILAVVLLVLNTFQSTAVFYLTPSELLAQAPSLYGEDVRLAGTIDKRSAEWDPETLTLKFNVFEGRDVVPVVYNGPKPDTFDLAEAVTIEGVYRQDGVFEARNLFLQCPSKYKAKLDEAQ
ncbi:MAG: cytochrome c maturation protein CcmE [Chloroflexi bacterium]|nr:MAG: cytochrome c maturation protein CcmE [Chloroflexota bacterium]